MEYVHLSHSNLIYVLLRRRLAYLSTRLPTNMIDLSTNMYFALVVCSLVVLLKSKFLRVILFSIYGVCSVPSTKSLRTQQKQSYKQMISLVAYNKEKFHRNVCIYILYIYIKSARSFKALSAARLTVAIC